MKIIFLEAIHNFGGAGKSTLELAKRLIAVHNEVLVVEFWGNCEPYIYQCEKEKVPYRIIDPREKPIMLKNNGKIKKIFNYLSYLRTNQKYKYKFQKIITEFNPDLICVNNTKTLAILKSSENYKIAYFARSWFLPSTFSYIDRKLLKKLVDVYLSVSQATRQMVYASGLASLSDIYVVPNAIEQEKLESFLASNETAMPWHKEREGSRGFVMMHCGSFKKTKGQHIAIKVLKKLIDKGENVRLLLVGMVSKTNTSKIYYEHILNYIKENKLDPYVDIVLNESEVLSYYTKSDLLIHPSYSEGLPRVVLEAMAFGKPVVGNSVGGVTDFILDNYTGFLTNFNAVDEYTEIIQNLINDKNLYEFISKNALALIVKNYTYDNQVKAFMKVEQYFNSEN